MPLFVQLEGSKRRCLAERQAKGILFGTSPMASIDDPIADFAFKNADLDILHAAGIRRVRDFETWTWWRLYALPGMNHRVLDRIDAVLKRFDIEMPNGVPPPRKPAAPPDETGRSLCEIANARTKRASAAIRPRYLLWSAPRRTRNTSRADQNKLKTGEETEFEPYGVCAQKRLARCKRVAALIAEGCRNIGDLATTMGMTQQTIYLTLRAPEFELPFVTCVGCGRSFQLKTRRDWYCSSDCEAAHTPPPPKKQAEVRASLKERCMVISRYIVQGLSGREIAKQIGVSYQSIYQTVSHPYFQYPVLACRHCGKAFTPTSIGDKRCNLCRQVLKQSANQERSPAPAS